MNWPDLITDVRIEIGLLDQLADESGDLIGLVNAGKADPTACLATGGVLQSFYNGVEKVFTLIVGAVADDLHRDTGDNPRRSLLQTVARDSAGRPAVIERELADQLARYLEFREAFRYAHFFQLNWEQTAPLVTDLRRTLDVFKTQIDAFFSAVGQGQGQGQRQKNSAIIAGAQSMPRYWSRPLEPRQVGLAPRKVVLAVLLAAALGLGAGAAAVKYRLASEVQRVPAKIVAPFLRQAKFTAPDGSIRRLPVSRAGEPFDVTAGRVAKGQEQPFTGRVQRKAAAPDGTGVLSISFHRGRAVFAEALGEDGRSERATMYNKKVIRYSLCNADGLPYRTYHVDDTGKAYCVIERAAAGDPAGEGWYYRFYTDGARQAQLFISGDGRIIDAGGDALESLIERKRK